MNRSRLLIVLLIVSIIDRCYAFIIPLPPLATGGTSYLFRSAQYKEGSFNSAPGNGRSYVEFNGQVSVNDIDVNHLDVLTNRPASLDVLIFQSEDYTKFGSSDSSSSGGICCTKSLYDQSKCSRLNTVIIPNAPNPNVTVNTNITESVTLYNTISYYNFIFTNISTGNPIQLPNMNYTINKEDGVYYVLVLSCTMVDDQQNSTTVYVAGTTTFMNPYGYLPGERYPFLSFDLVMSICYLILSIFWVYLFWRFRKTYLPLQVWIMAVIFLGFVENLIEYSTNSNANKTGQFGTTGILFITLFGTLRGGASRLVVLIVSMGYGILIPTIPRITKYKIGLLTILYCTFRVVQYYLYLKPQATRSDEISYIFLSLPVAIFDTAFYWWSFQSFMHIFSRLSLKKQQAKLTMYQQFFVILVLSAIVSVVVILIQLGVGYFKTTDQTWRTNWIWVSLWELEYFVILVSLAWIWRPTDNNQRFKYNEVVDVDDADNDVVLQPLGFGTSGLTLRSPTLDSDDHDDITINNSRQHHNNNHNNSDDDADNSTKVEMMDEVEELENFKKDSFKIFDL